MTRVNSIHSTQVDTPMGMNDAEYGCSGSTSSIRRGTTMSRVAGDDPLAIPWVDPVDVSNALLFLVFDVLASMWFGSTNFQIRSAFAAVW